MLPLVCMQSLMTFQLNLMRSMPSFSWIFLLMVEYVNNMMYFYVEVIIQHATHVIVHSSIDASLLPAALLHNKSIQISRFIQFQPIYVIRSVTAAANGNNTQKSFLLCNVATANCNCIRFTLQPRRDALIDRTFYYFIYCQPWQVRQRKV